MTGRSLDQILKQLGDARMASRSPVVITKSEPEEIPKPSAEDVRRWAEQEKANASDLFTRRASVLRQIITIDKRIQGATFDNYQTESAEQEKAVAACMRFADRFGIRYVSRKNVEIGLFMVGHYGTGKSHLASAILNRMEEQGFPGIYLDAVDLFDYVNSRDLPRPLPEIIEKLSLTAVLVIDELGVQTWSKAEQKRLQQIIDTRAKFKLPTILCTNLSQKELDECCGGRVVSRLAELTYTLKFEWADHRRCKAPSKLKVEEVF